MPTYDYVCDACGHAFELFQPITSKPIRTCPKCKQRKARRLIGMGAGIIFKGSGFYQTDYRSDSYKQGAAQAKPASAASSDSKSSDSKAAGDAKPAGESKPAAEPKAKKSSPKKK